MNFRLTVVIVTFGRTANLEKCLTSLAAQSFDDFDVVVVSNARGVQDVISRSSLLPRTQLVTCDMNRGYGAACNLGARLAAGPFVVFLNDDTYFDDEWLSQLYKPLCAAENSIFQSTIFHESTRQMRAGNPCDIYGAAGITFYKGCGAGEFYASGACLAMSKRVFDYLGGFDDALFMYHEDVDLCWRARLMGIKIAAAAKALCYHSGRGSSEKIPQSRKFYYTQRNRIRVLIKNYSVWRAVARLPVACSLILSGAVFLAFKTRTVGYIVCSAKAFIWNLRVLHNTLLERYSMQQRRNVDDTVIEKTMGTYSMDICALKRYVAKSHTFRTRARDRFVSTY